MPPTDQRTVIVLGFGVVLLVVLLLMAGEETRAALRISAKDFVGGLWKRGLWLVFVVLDPALSLLDRIRAQVFPTVGPMTLPEGWGVGFAMLGLFVASLLTFHDLRTQSQQGIQITHTHNVIVQMSDEKLKKEVTNEVVGVVLQTIRASLADGVLVTEKDDPPKDQKAE